MTQPQITEASEQQELDKTNPEEKNRLLSALVIGLMIGVVVFSIINNSIGFFTLIPLFFIYKVLSQKDTTG